jgi:hypothetical protein
MTVETCQDFCTSKGFSYAGTEYSTECCALSFFVLRLAMIFNNVYLLDCGNTLPDLAAASDTDCTYTCSGNTTEICGGSDRLSVYWSGTDGPSIIQTAGNWSIMGCYVDSVNSRLLSVEIAYPDGTSNTVEACTSACLAEGYAYAGVEWAEECCE